MVFTSSPREPDAPESVVVWPWRVVDEARIRDTATAGNGTTLAVSYLVFSESLERLEAVRLCLATNPIVMEADASFAIVSEPLGMEQQLQLFMAAGLRPRPCLSYSVRPGVASSSPPATRGPARAGLFLYAKDLCRLADFYQGLLGMTRRHSTDEVVVLGSPDILLTLHAIPAAIAATITLLDPPEPREDAALKFFFTVPSLAEAEERALSMGGRVLPGRWQGLGFRAANAVDPEGNIVQIREPSL